MTFIRASNSMLGTTAACQAKALLHTLGYTTSASPEPHLVVGSAIHSALEHWIWGEAETSVLGHLEGIYKPFSEKWVQSDDRLHWENVKRCVQAFLWSHPIDQMPFEPVAAEKSLEWELLPGVRLTDKSDGLIRMKDDGSLWCLEWKTMEYVFGKGGSDKITPQYRMDPQIDTHIWVHRQRGYDVKGVKLGAIEVRKLPEPTQAKCRTCKIPQAVCWPSHARSEFYNFQRTQRQLDDWRFIARENAKLYTTIVGANPDTAHQTGRYTRSCQYCEFNQYCYQGMPEPDGYGLVKREREPGVMYSGVYEDD